MRIALIAVLVPLAASCASSGLYNMTDTWCSAHPGASLARCPKKDAEHRVAVYGKERPADAEEARND